MILEKRDFSQNNKYECKKCFQKGSFKILKVQLI